MNKFFYPAICLLLIVVTTGCSSSGSRSCKPSKGLFANCRLFRNPFKGDPCSVCQPPMGQPSNAGMNVTPNCADGSCGLNVVMPEGQSASPTMSDPGIQYYGDQLNAPMTAPMQTQGYTPNYSGPGMETAPQMNYSPGVNTEIETPPMYGFGTMN